MSRIKEHAEDLQVWCRSDLYRPEPPATLAQDLLDLLSGSPSATVMHLLTLAAYRSAGLASVLAVWVEGHPQEASKELTDLVADIVLESVGSSRDKADELVTQGGRENVPTMAKLLKIWATGDASEELSIKKGISSSTLLEIASNLLDMSDNAEESVRL